MQVFDKDIQRENTRSKRSESHFAYLNRSAKAGAEASRLLIERWLGNLPHSEQLNLRDRFRCGDNVEFATAFQELFLHEFLRVQDCEVDFHPALPLTSKRPDFLVRPRSGTPFLLEACASTKVASGPESHPRADRIRDFLDGLTLPGYRLGIDEIKPGSNDLPQAKLRVHIERFLFAKPHKESAVRLPDFSTKDGWIIRLTAHRVDYELGAYSSTVLLEAYSRNWEGPAYPMRAVLKRKAGKYGALSMPYVIALNSFDGMLSSRDFEETLFGVPSNVSIAGMTPDLASGLWGSIDRPTHQRVSAVLFTKNLWPATVLAGQVYCSLWLNPWANCPYTGLLEQLPVVRLAKGQFLESQGRKWHEIMGSKNFLDSSYFS